VVRQRQAIAALLDAEGLLDEAILLELDHLVEYAQLEHRLVRAAQPSRADWERACALRTSDVRMLHRVLVRMLGRPYDESVFRLMWPLEAIMDLELDLEDYPRDVASGAFNTLALLERIAGGGQAFAQMQAQLEAYEALYLERLCSADAATQQRFQRILERYQADHPRPAFPAEAALAAAGAAAEPRLL
jgi:hypothetical protein